MARRTGMNLGGYRRKLVTAIATEMRVHRTIMCAAWAALQSLSAAVRTELGCCFALEPTDQALHRIARKLRLLGSMNLILACDAFERFSGFYRIQSAPNMCCS